MFLTISSLICFSNLFLFDNSVSSLLLSSFFSISKLDALNSNSKLFLDVYSLTLPFVRMISFSSSEILFLNLLFSVKTSYELFSELYFVDDVDIFALLNYPWVSCNSLSKIKILFRLVSSWILNSDWTLAIWLYCFLIVSCKERMNSLFWLIEVN